METNDPCTGVIVHPFILITAAALCAETCHAPGDCKYYTSKYSWICIFIFFVVRARPLAYFWVQTSQQHSCYAINSSKYLTETPTGGAAALENIDFTCDLMTYRPSASRFLPASRQMHAWKLQSGWFFYSCSSCWSLAKVAFHLECRCVLTCHFLYGRTCYDCYLPAYPSSSKLQQSSSPLAPYIKRYIWLPCLLQGLMHYAKRWGISVAQHPGRCQMLRVSKLW